MQLRSHLGMFSLLTLVACGAPANDDGGSGNASGTGGDAGASGGGSGGEAASGGSGGEAASGGSGGEAASGGSGGEAGSGGAGGSAGVGMAAFLSAACDLATHYGIFPDADACLSYGFGCDGEVLHWQPEAVADADLGACAAALTAALAGEPIVGTERVFLERLDACATVAASGHDSLPVGDACWIGGPGCASGSYCEAATQPGVCDTCSPYPELGEPCGLLPSGSVPCDVDAELSCAVRLDTFAGTCVPRLAGGAPCLWPMDCQSLDCTGPTVCADPDRTADPTDDPTDGCSGTNAPWSTCRPLDRQDVGGACVENVHCANHLRCDWADGTCKAPSPPGSPCLVNDGPGVCAGGTACVEGICRAVAHCGAGMDGAPCAERGDCATGFGCGFDNTCVADAAEHESCAGGQSCDEGLSCLPFTQTCEQPGDLGEACDPTLWHRDCLSGLCDPEAGPACADPLDCTLPI